MSCTKDQLDLFPQTPIHTTSINAVTSLDMSTSERLIFISYIDKVLDMDGDGHYHYLWRGPLNNKNLPIYYHRQHKRIYAARRVAHILFLGPIPENSEVFSTCRFPTCVGYNCLDTRSRDRHPNLLTFTPARDVSGKFLKGSKNG